MNIPGLDAHRQCMIGTSVPEDRRDRERWFKDVGDVLRPIRHITDSDVMRAIRFASRRLWDRAA